MDKQEVLRRYFGHGEFREGQETLIDALLAGRDALGIMPTGGGKSLCYQVPALLLPGVTLVISPLISLMKDQVMALEKAGVPAAFLNSSLSAVGAFTATATDLVRRDIVELLGLRDPVRVVTGFDRPNLFFDARQPRNKGVTVLELLRQRERRSGIVYCATRAAVESGSARRCGSTASRPHGTTRASPRRSGGKTRRTSSTTAAR